MVNDPGADARWNTREVSTLQEQRKAGVDREWSAEGGTGLRELPRSQMAAELGADVQQSTRAGTTAY